MKNVSWKRVVITVCIIEVIVLISAKEYLFELAQPAPFRFDVPDPSIIRISISGKVFYPEGKSAPNITVYLLEHALVYSQGHRGLEDKIMNEINTDTNGYYKFDNVQGYNPNPPNHTPGLNEPNYEIIAFTKGYGLGGIHPKPIGDLINCNVFLHTDHKITGIVVDRYEKPIPGASVTIPKLRIQYSNDSTENFTFYNKNIDFLRTITDQKGEFQITGIPIEKDIAVNVGKENYFGSDIKDGKDGQNLKFVLKDMFNIAGRVEYQSNHYPVKEYELIILKDNSFYRKQHVWDYGFQLSNFNEGKYAIYLNMPGHVSNTTHFELNRQNPSREIILYARETSY